MLKSLQTLLRDFLSKDDKNLFLGELDAVYRLAVHLCARQEAEDAVQETFLRAFKAVDSFHLTEFGPRPWLENTVHLLYGSIKPTVRDTLSIFVQPYTEQVKAVPDHIILITRDAPHPMFVWRSDHAVYFLVTDDLETAEKARDVIQVAMSR